MKSLALCLVGFLATGAACGSDNGGTPDGATSDGGVDAVLADAGASCGGLLGTPCAADHFCDYPDNMCGATDGTGVCVPRPTGCPDVYMPVCACDGQVHGNDCEAQMAGYDLNQLGGCTSPANTFACGWRFCTIAAEYCRIDVSDVATIPNDYSCIALPGSCGDPPTCLCLANERCGDLCAGEGASGLTLTCPGG